MINKKTCDLKRIPLFFYLFVVSYFNTVFRDISDAKKVEKEKESLLSQL
jgi:hypothetical protein